jgi:hypothetical protein
VTLMPVVEHVLVGIRLATSWVLLVATRRIDSNRQTWPITTPNKCSRAENMLNVMLSGGHGLRVLLTPPQNKDSGDKMR